MMVWLFKKSEHIRTISFLCIAKFFFFGKLLLQKIDKNSIATLLISS